MTDKERKEAIERFREVSAWVLNATQHSSALETEADKDKRRIRARKDFAFFMQHYLAHYAKSAPAWFHLKAAQVILKYSVLRFIAAWYRGSAKSVVFNIGIPLWLKIQEEREYNTFVLVGKSNDSADILISDLQAELENNQKYIYDFGVQKSGGDWQEGKFTTQDGVSYFSLGRGQSPRGLRKKSFRPDFIVIDDIDDDELVENEARVRKVIDWINKALILSMDKGRGRVIFANNIIHDKSVVAQMAERYRQLIKQAKKALNKDATANDRKRGARLKVKALKYHYEVMVVNIRDKSGKSSWPDNMSEAEIDELEHELGYAYAQTELYNNPISEGKVFKKEWMQHKRLPALNQYKSLVAYFDPGYKNTSTSDSMALLLMGMHRGEYHVIKAYCDKVTRMGAVDWHYDLHDFLTRHNAAAEYWMEEKFMLDILYEDFDAAAIQRGYPIPVVGDTRPKPDKDLRIRSTAGAFERGKVYFNAAEEDNHHMQQLINQFLAFEPPKKTLKDGPDAFEGCGFILRQRNQDNGGLPISGPMISHNITRW